VIDPLELPILMTKLEMMLMLQAQVCSCISISPGFHIKRNGKLVMCQQVS